MRDYEVAEISKLAEATGEQKIEKLNNKKVMCPYGFKKRSPHNKRLVRYRRMADC